jgi:hypothetical protein
MDLIIMLYDAQCHGDGSGSIDSSSIESQREKKEEEGHRKVREQ